MPLELSTLLVDVDRMAEGVRLNLADDVHITVRSASCDLARKARERIWRSVSGWPSVPPETADRLNARWLAEAIIAEFDGFLVDGKPFTVDLTDKADQARLAELLAVPGYRALRNRILIFALEDANYSAAPTEA